MSYIVYVFPDRRGRSIRIEKITPPIKRRQQGAARPSLNIAKAGWNNAPRTSSYNRPITMSTRKLRSQRFPPSGHSAAISNFAFSIHRSQFHILKNSPSPTPHAMRDSLAGIGILPRGSLRAFRHPKNMRAWAGWLRACHILNFPIHPFWPTNAAPGMGLRRTCSAAEGKGEGRFYPL